MKRIIATIIAATALLVGALPAGASNSPTGVRLSLLSGGPDRAILADTPFFVKHGFIIDSASTSSEIQQSQINLTLDGNKQSGSVDQELDKTTKPPTLVAKWFLWNYASGLPVGTHVFHIDFVFQGKVVLTRDITIYSLASCENGTTNGLLCAPPPA